MPPTLIDPERRVRRSLPLIAATICLSLSLTACGSGSFFGSASGATPNGTLVIWADEKRAEALRPFADAFAAAHGAKAEIVAVTENQQERFVEASKAGTGPDVMIGAHDWIGNLVLNGYIDPVLVLDNKMEDYLDVARRAVMYNGEFYGIPYAVESLVLFRAVDDQLMIAWPLGNLGRLALQGGDYAQAQAAFEESVALCRAAGNKLGAADWLIQVATVALLR